MSRTVRTLLLAFVIVGALATAAVAAPTTPLMSHGATSGVASMHATGTMQMHAASGDMTARHAAMTTDPAIHEAMINDPEMRDHMAEYGVDTGQMRRWHETGVSADQMHEALAAQGIDVAAMHADCPRLTDDSMAAMHGRGGHDPSNQHRAAGR